jgi:hypothetical protein
MNGGSMLRPFQQIRHLAILIAIRLAWSRRLERKLSAFTIETSPNPGPDCLGLISNSEGAGQEHDLSYRIMVDAGFTPAELDHCSGDRGASSCM